jgi:hypothetical protein
MTACPPTTGKLKYTQRFLTMAFDLKGSDPRNYDGEWIRFNIWSWHRICRGIEQLFPEEYNGLGVWYTNSGQFVDPETCQNLANYIERYGDERFGMYCGDLDMPIHPDSIGDKTLSAGIPFEMNSFIKFLRSCNGFTIT